MNAFSSPSVYNRQQRAIIPCFSHQRVQPNIQRTTKISTTQLHEQAANIKKLLGPVSPSTLEKYNLPPEVLSQVWAAQIVSQTAKSLEEGTDIQLIPKNSAEHYVDSLKIEVPLPSLDSPGLGIELLELEGGREDGLGITIVNGLVSGGNAESAVEKSRRTKEGEVIMYGDSITAAELIMNCAGGRIDVNSINTECLGYESTVDALVGMLGSLNNNNSIQDASIMLTLKRIRRRPNIKVTLQYPPDENLPSETLQLGPGDNLRMVMLARGVKLNDPMAQRYDGKAANGGNCGGGALCRTCAVSVLRGGELLSRPKQAESKMMEDMQGMNVRSRLACKSWVGYGMEEGEIVIQVNPRRW